jgi:beta-glucanase (GH16 family)
MHRAIRLQIEVPLLVLAAWALAACARQNANAVDPASCQWGNCAGRAATTTTNGSGAGTGGAGGAVDGGGRASGSGGRTGTGGNSAGSGGRTGTGGGTTGGTNGSGGSTAAGTGGTTNATGGSPATDAGSVPPDYTLVVDAPSNGDTVQGSVTVSGRASGFMNVEVWDAMHQMPPLGQATPSADGTFTMTIDVSALSTGATTWTVYAWDSPPGQAFMHTTNVTRNLTINAGSADPGSCTGQTCSGLGTCSVTGGQASCACSTGYHAAGLACVADTAGNDGQPDPGTTYVPSGYTLKFSDEFTGSTLDTAKWNTLGPFGVQFFTDSHQKQAFVPEAVSLNNGILTFTAQHTTASNANGQPYSSGSITTNGTFTYGYFETRARVPAGKGFWPAYWLTSSTRWPPEWDIFEIIDNVIYGYTHPISSGKCMFVEGASGSDSTYMISNLYGMFHIYGFKWTASDIYWYVDGVMTEHYAIDAAAGANDPFWLNISLQVGGDWPGDPDGTTPFPAHMDVDYMRVYQ